MCLFIYLFVYLFIYSFIYSFKEGKTNDKAVFFLLALPFVLPNPPC